jgi:PhnB protein
MNNSTKTAVIPMLYIPHGVMDIDFYKNAFGAEIIRCFTNDDGSIHVAELIVDGAMFRFHEENEDKGSFSPGAAKGITTNIGLRVADVDAVMARAVAAGAKETSPAQDYDYGYRQGDIVDPFGHTWTIESGDLPL